MPNVLTAPGLTRAANRFLRLGPPSSYSEPADPVSERAQPTAITAALDRLSRSGRIGRELAWHLDRGRVNGLAGLLTGAGLPGVQGEIEERWNSYYRSIWERAACDVGADVEDLTRGFLRLRRGSSATVVWQSNVMLDNPVTLRLALDKSISARILSQSGIPVPDQLEFDAADAFPAKKLLLENGGSWVLKPASGTAGGKGVSCGVLDTDDLVRACVRARRWDRRILMQRQLVGHEYRLLFFEGELLDVIRRRPPRVYGDGRSTVKQLIGAENELRRSSGGHAGLPLLDADLDCILALRAEGFSLQDVPVAGLPVRVKTAVGLGGPKDAAPVDDLCPQAVETASLSARLLGVRLAGVDLITPDPSKDLDEAGGAIVEVNALPGLHYHYLVADPAQATPVASLILERLLGMADDGKF